MYTGTPNEEFIDPWLEELRERYRCEKLKQMSLERLHGMEFEIENQFLLFKADFPHGKSAIQGELRAFVHDNPNAAKESLTSAERERLRQAKNNLKHEVFRAKGYRKEKRREHRSDLMNSAVDLGNAISRSILGIWATAKEITP